MMIMRCSYGSLNGRKTILQTSYGFLTTRKTVTKLTWERPANKKNFSARHGTAAVLILQPFMLTAFFDYNQITTYRTKEIGLQTNCMFDVNKTTGDSMSFTSTNWLSCYKLVRL